jgi:Rad3-related DNA helicase
MVLCGCCSAPAARQESLPQLFPGTLQAQEDSEKWAAGGIPPTQGRRTSRRELEKESIVVFDEAHNIDNVCIEALSVSMRQQTMDAAAANINKLNSVRRAAHCWPEGRQAPPLRRGAAQRSGQD